LLPEVGGSWPRRVGCGLADRRGVGHRFERRRTLRQHLHGRCRHGEHGEAGEHVLEARHAEPAPHRQQQDQRQQCRRHRPLAERLGREQQQRHAEDGEAEQRRQRHAAAHRQFEEVIDAGGAEHRDRDQGQPERGGGRCRRELRQRVVQRGESVPVAGPKRGRGAAEAEQEPARGVGAALVPQQPERGEQQQHRAGQPDPGGGVEVGGDGAVGGEQFGRGRRIRSLQPVAGDVDQDKRSGRHEAGEDRQQVRSRWQVVALGLTRAEQQAQAGQGRGQAADHGQAGDERQGQAGAGPRQPAAALLGAHAATRRLERERSQRGGELFAGQDVDRGQPR